MSKHTPGPWECCGDSISGGKHVPANPKADSHPYEIATIAYSERNYPWIPQGEVRDANARLIAAAPELLEALLSIALLCESVIKEQPDAGHYAHMMARSIKAKARAAVEKTEGRD